MTPRSNRPHFQNAAFLHLLTRPFDRKRPAWAEVLILIALCSLDMFSTIYWIKTGKAREANPFLAWTFHLSPVLFVVIKAGTFLPAAALAAFMARRYPRFITWLLRAVILLYVAFYGAGVFKLLHFFR